MNVEVQPQRSVSSFVGVEKVEPAIRDLSMFDEPSYIDCFVLSSPDAVTSTPEAWSRAILERAALSRGSARRLWTLIGLRLGPPGSPDHVQGWRIESRGDNWLRLETASWYMDANAVCLVEQDQVSLSLSLRYTSPVAPLVWTPIMGPHQRAVPVMMRQAADLLAKETSTGQSA